MTTVLLVIYILGYLLWCALMIVPLWRVHQRAGLTPWFSLIFAVPVAGPIAVLAILAFMDWPAKKGL